MGKIHPFQEGIFTRWGVIYPYYFLHQPHNTMSSFLHHLPDKNHIGDTHEMIPPTQNEINGNKSRNKPTHRLSCRSNSTIKHPCLPKNTKFTPQPICGLTPNRPHNTPCLDYHTPLYHDALTGNTTY